MSKVISILGLFLIFSCGNRIEQRGVVTSVQEFKKGRYEVQVGTDYFYTDSIYRVGDTLIFAKKEIKHGK